MTTASDEHDEGFDRCDGCHHFRADHDLDAPNGCLECDDCDGFLEP